MDFDLRPRTVHPRLFRLDFTHLILFFLLASSSSLSLPLLMSTDPLLALLGDASSLLISAAPAAGSSGAPPILRDRGVGAVPSLGTPPSKMYSVVKLDRSIPGLCFGMIGVGSAFCFKVD